jgi:hypothetical protein
MSADSVQDPQVRARAAAGHGLRPVTIVAGRQPAAAGTVAELCAEFSEVCESAVDPLEIASALEFEGLSDQAVQVRYGYRDVFALAQEMYSLVPRHPAEPEPLSDPWQTSRLRPALHGLLYGLPAICFPAAAGLLGGPGVLITLVVALLAAWGLSQGLAYLGYLRLGTADLAATRRTLRAGLLAGLAVVGLAMTAAAVLAHARPEVLMFGAGEGAYMLGACVLMVLAADRWLLVALAPGVLGSAAFLLLGRPPGLEHAVWAALAATPAIAVALAVICTRRRGDSTGRAVTPAELLAAVPAVLFGLIAAGLLSFPVAAGVNGHGGINVGALLAALPLSLSMGAAEWSLLWYRRRMRRLVRTTGELTEFGGRARLMLCSAVLQYLAGAVALTAVAAWIAAAAHLVQLRGPVLAEIAAYLALGCAMFIGLLLQALGARWFALIACAAALAAEITFRHAGATADLAASAGLLLVLGCYAAWELSRAVRHAY